MSPRGMGRSVLGWAFGIALTILFISLWGRAVVVDTDTLGESLGPLARSGRVVEFIADWMVDEMVEAGEDPDMAGAAVGYLLESSQLGVTLDNFAAEVVSASAAPDSGGASIDMTSLVAPAVPDVTFGLQGLGYAISEHDVEEIVEGLDPLVIRDAGTAPVVGPQSPTATRLGTAAVLAIVALLAFGYLFVTLSDDRLTAARGLVSRVAVGGLSFGVLLRLGSWILDPNRGRAPIPETVSALARSKWLVPFQVGLVAGLVALTIFVVSRVLTRGEGSRPLDAPPTRQLEQPTSLSGLR